MLLCLEFQFNDLSREIWGSKSNLLMWNTLKPNAAEIKATVAAIN